MRWTNRNVSVHGMTKKRPGPWFKTLKITFIGLGIDEIKSDTKHMVSITLEHHLTTPFPKSPQPENDSSLIFLDNLKIR